MSSVSSRVLVVDDAPYMRDGLAKILEGAGLEVVAAVGDGVQARRAFEQLDPDLVALDLVMPTCDGLAATCAILSQDLSARIVICSCEGQEVQVMQALQAGARDYIVKPYREECVMPVVRRVLSG